MSLANQDCVWHPNTIPPHTHTFTMPLNSRVNENAFAIQCTATVHDCQPTLQMPTSLLKRHHSVALYPNLLLTYFYHLPLSCFSFFCFLITNPVAPGGCAWVNRAVGACHVCSSGEKSSQRLGMRWFVVIDSYLETGLMELSKLYANSLFSYHCRCTLLRCTAHTRAHTCTFPSIRHIMGTQIFIRTMVLKCNTRRDSQISNPILLSGLFLYKQAFCTDSFTLPPLPYHSLVFSAKLRQSCIWGCRLGLTLGVWIQWQSYIWELSGKTIPFLTCAVRRGCSFLQGG